MVLAGHNGHRLELELLGYQFPAIEDDEWDSNWLNIRISATNDQGSWNATDPSVGTVEVAELADWLEAIAEREEPACELEFIEPNLAFEPAETNGRVRLRAWFELELRPSGPRPTKSRLEIDASNSSSRGTISGEPLIHCVISFDVSRLGRSEEPRDERAQPRLRADERSGLLHL